VSIGEMGVIGGQIFFSIESIENCLVQDSLSPTQVKLLTWVLMVEKLRCMIAPLLWFSNLNEPANQLRQSVNNQENSVYRRPTDGATKLSPY
jgi:hypothetical protein